MQKCYNEKQGITMPNTLEYPAYISPSMHLTVSLCSLLFQYNRGDEHWNQGYENTLLADWINPIVDREVESSLTKGILRYWTDISHAIATKSNCSENYVQMHLAYYQYTNIKEYFNEYQTLKLNIF